MPSFGDSAFIFILALLLFGPKKLPELARQLGKLMAEFRRASNEFRMQMDEELRLADQAEQQKKIAAMEAAAPITPPIGEVAPEPEHPYQPTPDAAIEALPIASEGDLSLMPPATGLPVPRSTDSRTDAETETSALAPVLEDIPHDPAATSDHYQPSPDHPTHTFDAVDHPTEAQSTQNTPSEAPIHG